MRRWVSRAVSGQQVVIVPWWWNICHWPDGVRRHSEVRFDRRPWCSELYFTMTRPSASSCPNRAGSARHSRLSDSRSGAVYAGSNPAGALSVTRELRLGRRQAGRMDQGRGDQRGEDARSVRSGELALPGTDDMPVPSGE